MNIDWVLITTLAAPLIALVVGILLNRKLNRPVVTTYLGHISTHRVDAQPHNVFTHSVVIQNNGWRAASNVRITHSNVPGLSVSVLPDVTYQVSDLPGGGREILFPSLVPGEQVTVSYLYFPPVTIDQINRAWVKSDEGLAKVIQVIPMKQYPQWVNRLMAVLFFAGTISLLYVLVVLVRWLVS